MDPYCLDHRNPPLWRNRHGGVKAAAWQTFRRRWTLRHAVKNKRVTVQDPVKKPQMDYMSHRGGGGARGGRGGVPPRVVSGSNTFGCHMQPFWALDAHRQHETE